ncbi:hypothetical protein Tsubulata_047693, partial [Turnera subulata]
LSLTRLELKGLPFGSPVGTFTSITTLYLKHCSFYGSGDSGGCFDAFANFPCLINLTLYYCIYQGFKVFRISGPQMLNLTITGMKYSHEWLAKGCKLEISAPNLTFFSYEECRVVDFSAFNLPSLKRSKVHIQIPRLHRPLGMSQKQLQILEEHKNSTYHDLFVLLQGLRNAQHLTLSFPTCMSCTRYNVFG